MSPQVSSYPGEELIHHLRKGQTLSIDETGRFAPVTWGKYLLRWIFWKQARQQDCELAEGLRRYLNAAQKSNCYSELLLAFDKYAKMTKLCERTDEAFKRLEQTIFAHKCCKELSCLSLQNLINEDGTKKHFLYEILKANHLHYIIPKEQKETALLFDGENIYIRAKNGVDFLEKPEKIALILQQLPPHHEDVLLLKELQKLLSHRTILEESNRFREIRNQLKIRHYSYIRLEDLHTNDRGLLITEAYLMQGIQPFDRYNWSKLEPVCYRKSDTPAYKFHTITRLPDYALEESGFKIFKILFFRLLDFNFRYHGHGWGEMTEPIYDDDGEFTGFEKVFNFGYYIDFFRKNLRIEIPDHMTYMPIPSNSLMREEVEIFKEEFETAVLYIEKFQELLKKYRNNIHARLQDPLLSDKQKFEIHRLFDETVKNTCISFVNNLKHVLTRIETDSRSDFMRWMFPKREVAEHISSQPYILRLPLISRLLSILKYILNIELPYWFKQQSLTTPKRKPSIQNQDCFSNQADQLL